MLTKWKNWAHVTKLDPDKVLHAEDIANIATSGTDALMLSGTLNITQENMKMLRDQVSAYDLPLVVEPSGPHAVIADGIDLLFIPSVLNTSNLEWIIGKHKSWVMQEHVPWERVIPEAYIVLNPNSSVAKVTGAQCFLSNQEVVAFCEVADQYFHFPLIYIEYSGTYGDPGIVKDASESISNGILYYGGGIDSPEKAYEMSRYADTIVVGNAVYEKGVETLKATVKAIQ